MKLMTVRIQTGGLDVKRRAVRQYLRRAAYIDVAEIVVKDVAEHTAQGVGPDGSTYQPYSKDYAKIRKNAGLQTSRVDLRVTGKMIDKTRLVGHQVKPIASAMGRAKGHQLGNPKKNLPARPWLWVSDKAGANVRQTVKKAVVWFFNQ